MTSRTIRCASVLGIGWIPYYKSLNRMGHNAYHDWCDQGWRRWAGCDLLFYSGNDRPPEDIFEHPQEFINYIERKDYRGALMLHDIELHCYENGECEVTYDYLKPPEEHVGYTPWRLLPLRSKRVLRYAKGEGVFTNKPDAHYTDDGVIVSYEVHFRIGRLGNLGCRLFTKYWAPFIRMRADYYIRRSGPVTIKVSGSYIPTQLHYTVGPDEQRTRVYFHDMEHNNQDQIVTVLASASDVAEGGYYHSSNGSCW